MATNRYRGDAQARAQLDTITVGGTITAGNTATLTCNGKTVVYTVVTGDTLLTVVANWIVAITNALSLEFHEYTSEQPDLSASVFTLESSTPGVPFAVTVSATGTLTAAVVVTTTSKGPEHLDDAGNWTLGLPVDGQDILFDFDAPPGRYGGDAFAAVTPASVTIRSEVVGLPDRNVGDYLEYRFTKLQFLACVLVTIESTSGQTPETVRLDLVNPASSTFNINCAGGGGQTRSPDGPPVRLTASGANAHTVNLLSGNVGMASGFGETFRCSTLRVGTSSFGDGEGSTDEDPFLQIGSGATLTGTHTPYSGVVDCEATWATLNMRGNGAKWIQRGINGGATLDMTAGYYDHLSTGNIATSINARGENSILDFSGGIGAMTIPAAGSVSVKGGAKIINPQKRFNFAGAMDRASLLVAEIGDEFTVTQS